MELASSSVRRTPSQYLTEGVACFRGSDSGATHGVVASSSSSASSYGFLSSRSCASQGGNSVARVIVTDQVSCGTSGSLYRSSEPDRPSGRRFGSRVYKGSSRLGQVLATESWTQLGDVAGPSGRTLRKDARICYLDASMITQGLAGGSKTFGKSSRSKAGEKNGPSSSFQLGHAAASAGYRSESNPQLQKRIIDNSSGHSGWNLKHSVGFSNLPWVSKRTASCYRITCSLNGRFSSEQARRNIRAAATPSDYRMSYPEVSDAVESSSYTIQDGDTLTSIAKKFQTSVPVLARVNKIEDVDLLLAGQPLLIPRAYERVPGPGVDIDEFPVPSGYELRAHPSRTVYNQVGYTNVSKSRASSARTSAQESRSQVLAASVMPAVGPNFAKFAVPVLLIAPLLGFCIRCIVDALHIHMDREEAKRQSERESSVETLRPKAQRWQKILEEDRDSDDGDGPNLMNEWPKDNVWSSELTGPTKNIWSAEVTGVMDAEAVEKTREILSIDQDEEVVIRDEKEDYEEIRKSYAELESSYMKFLVDSGLSKSGYWRGGVPTTTAHNGEPQ